MFVEDKTVVRDEEVRRRPVEERRDEVVADASISLGRRLLGERVFVEDKAVVRDEEERRDDVVAEAKVEERIGGR